jgi:hypothetical protein
MHFQRNFKNWTSDNDDIDKFIQATQLFAHSFNNSIRALEWIPYNKFYDIKYIAKENIYRANWIDGNINRWDYEEQKWNRTQNMVVILKSLDNPNQITSGFTDKVLKI